MSEGTGDSTVTNSEWWFTEGLSDEAAASDTSGKEWSLLLLVDDDDDDSSIKPLAVAEAGTLSWR